MSIQYLIYFCRQLKLPFLFFQKEVVASLMITMNHKILLKRRLTMKRTYILIQLISFHLVLLKAVDLISKDLKLVQMMRTTTRWMELILL